MHKYLLLLIAFFCLVSAQAQHTPWRPGEMEVKVTLMGSEQQKALNAFGFKGDIYGEFAIMYLISAELEMIKKAGFGCSIVIPDLNAWSAGFGEALVPPGYYTVSQLKNIADSLATNFPEICRKVIFGMTPQMKELAALKISDNVDVDENEAEIMFDGGIHGNEVGGSQNMILFARDLCLDYGSDPTITNLVNNREIWIYYCVNPYGRDNMLRENSNGVDINRDFGYMWGGEGGSTGPFSQVESRALRDCQYSNQFVIYTNYHSGDEIISYPWSYRYSPAPDKTQFENLANIYSSSSGYSSLPFGQGSQVMYLIQGSTKDFNYGCLGSVAWSIEISLDKQPAGPNIQYYYDINKPAMLALVEHSGYGIEGTVTDAITGRPVKAAIYVGNNYPTFTDGDAGDYHKYLVPDTYDLRFTANGYEPLTINNVVVNALQSTVTDVQLQPVCSQFGYRTCTVRIPGFNAGDPGDEGYTAACLGAPDQVNYSIGKGGYVMVDMLTPVTNEPGLDVTVFEGDASPEGFTLYALTEQDGYWNYLGFATGTASFDLETAGLASAQYFLVLDDNNGTANVSDAGFDLDAIKNIHPAIPDTLGHLSGRVFDAITGSPLPGAMISVADSTTITDTAGYYSIDPVRGTYPVCATQTDCTIVCDTIELDPGVIVTHDFTLFCNVGLKKKIYQADCSVNPNPFENELTIRFTNETAGRVQIRLTPITGAGSIILADEIYPSGEKQVACRPTELPGNELPAGIYILSIGTDTSSKFLKIIKVK